MEPGQGGAYGSLGPRPSPSPARGSDPAGALSLCTSWPLVSCGSCPPWSPFWRPRALQSGQAQWCGWAGDCAYLIFLVSASVTWALPGGWAQGASRPGADRRYLPLPSPAQNRGRLADKRTAALPPARGLKKELTPSFLASDGDSDGSSSACGQQPGLKQEDDSHVRIMKRRYFHHRPGCRGFSGSRGARDTRTGQVEASSGLGKGVLCSWELPQQSLDPQGQHGPLDLTGPQREPASPPPGDQVDAINIAGECAPPGVGQGGGVDVVPCGEVLRRHRALGVGTGGALSPGLGIGWSGTPRKGAWSHRSQAGWAAAPRPSEFLCLSSFNIFHFLLP